MKKLTLVYCAGLLIGAPLVADNDTYQKRQSRRDRDRHHHHHHDRQGGGVGVQLGGVAFGLGDGVFLVGRAPDNDLPISLPVYPGDSDCADGSCRRHHHHHRHHCHGDECRSQR